jgi:hypothetical protein
VDVRDGLMSPLVEWAATPSIIPPVSEPLSRVARTFEGVFAERLVGLAVYGSVATGDAIPGFSDLDLCTVLTDALTVDDAIELQRAMPEPAGVAYMQATFHSAAAPEAHLIPGAFRLLTGTLPAAFLIDEEGLRKASAETLSTLPALVEQDTRAWPGAIGEKRLRHVRLMTTRLKPAVRAALVQCGDPPFATWRAPWDELVDRWHDYDARRAKDLASALALLRSTPMDAQPAGEALLRLLASFCSATRLTDQQS